MPLANTADIAVYEVTGDYDAEMPDGAFNASARQEVAEEFYKAHPDDYDFLVIFSNFDFRMLQEEATAFYHEVKNDVLGIGKELIDNSSLYGSDGMLQGIIDMGSIYSLASDPLEAGFSETMATLSHELLHRWASHTKFRGDDGGISAELLGKGGYHWSFLLDTAGSLEYGNRWLDNGNGTFTSLSGGRYFSPLDMYLMGLIEKSEVPPMLLIDNPAIDPERLPEHGVTIEGTPRSVTIDMIIAAEGVRVPGAADSRKSFRVGTIFLVRPGTYREADLAAIRAVMNSWAMWFSGLTNGLGKITIADAPLPGIPENPGPEILPVDPRTAPPEISDGVAWLLNNQKADGSWRDSPSTAIRDTAAVLAALADFADTAEATGNGVSWMEIAATENIDYLARKIERLGGSEKDVAALAAEVIDRQNPDGGWGSGDTYDSNPADSALALRALVSAGEATSGVAGSGIAYLLRKQNGDRGWGADGRSSVQTTVEVITALIPFREQYQLDVPLSTALSWASARQNPDGGFGNGPSTIYDTALALIAMRRMGVSSVGADKALAYLLDRQGADGSWQSSAYQTALAVKSIWLAIREPDLSLSTAEIVPTPDKITSLPSDLSLAITVRNSGMSDVAEPKVVLYEGALSESGKIGEQTFSVAGQSSETIVFDTSVRDGNPHHYYVVVDPDNLIKESSEQNNSALRIVYPESTYDFRVASEDVSVSPTVGSIFEPIVITARVANGGTIDAFSVPLHLVVDQDGGIVTAVTRSVNLPAGQSVDVPLTWVPGISGVALPLSVILDPHETFAETDEENNAAMVAIDIQGSTKPDLALAYSDIAIDPVPALEAGRAMLQARVHNQGFASVTDVRVDFMDGVPGESDATLLGSAVIAAIAAGESADAVFEWSEIPVFGERLITVGIDPDNQIEEIKEDNNNAFTTLQVLSLPDFAVNDTAISFSPEAPHEGDQVTVTIVVQNKGEQQGVNVPVAFRAGGELLDTAIIPEITANGQAAAEITFDTAGRVGIIDIEVIVDPDSTILEQDRTNNRAMRGVGVQNGDLWLSDNYISPNGDGIKDKTRFGCRLSVAQDVTVAVVNEEGEVVREYSGPDFTGATYISLAWDGLDNRGRVVDDGQYRIQVLGKTGVVLSSLLVTVDNNRSPLLKAVGTPYLFNTKVEYLLRGRKYKWLPDDSAIIVHLDAKYPLQPEYDTGIYSISPTGGNILRIVPEEWSEGADPEIGYRYVSNASDCNNKSWMLVECDQVNPGFSFADDGSIIAFVLEKYNKSSSLVIQQQLWAGDRFGDKLILLETIDYLQGDIERITDIFPSPDGRYIAYKLYNQNTDHHYFAIIKVDGTEKKVYAPEWGNGFDYQHRLTWAPDGNRLVFSDAVRAVVADLAGSMQEILPIENATVFFDWYGSSRILVRDLDTTNWLLDSWSVDLNAPESPMLIADNSPMPYSWYEFGGCIKREATGSVSKTPLMRDGNFIAGYSSEEYPYVNYLVCNVSGECQNTNLVKLGWPNPSLTPDSAKVVNNDIDGILSIFDIDNKKKEIFKLGYFGCDKYFEEEYNIPSEYTIWPPTGRDCAEWSYLDIPRWYWFNDETFLSLYYGTEERLLAFNIDNGERVYFDEDSGAWKWNIILSPNKRYLSYLLYDKISRSYDHFKVTGSFLNLTAELHSSKSESEVNFRGITADLNFASWQLEYADRETPNDWRIITPPMEKPVVDSLLATWIPPYEGSFLVRLTVSDKAGNTGWDRKVVTWGKKFSVTDIHKTGELFSPNDDGVKDTVGLNYTVHEPVHLELSVHDLDGIPIRTFYQDHSLPGEYGIVWDGRDESGGIVPDGYYTIRIFDYEFFVQVDTTPPDGRLEFSPFECGKDPALSSRLTGLALDTNLKSWTVSYGLGEAPREWHAFKSGETFLAETFNGVDIKLDDSGNPVPAGLQLFTSESSPSLGFLGNATFRIVIEDFAGNQSVVAARFDRELLVLAGWDGNRIELTKNEFPEACESPDILSIDYLAAGMHTLEIVETLNKPIRTATIQYRMHMQWHEAGVITDPADGNIELIFDTSSLAPEEIAAVRVKLVDDSGLEYFSNTVVFNPPRFSAAMNCIPVGSLAPALIDLDVSLPEELATLKFQAAKTVAGNSVWDTLAEYEVFDGFPYQFAAPFPDRMPEDYGYPLRFIGISEGGRSYTSNELTGPPEQCEQGGGGEEPPRPEPGCGKTTLGVSSSREKAPCNSVGESTAKIAVYYCPTDGPKVLPDHVKYYLEDGGQWRFLKQFQPAVEGWGQVMFETADLSDGKHKVRVDLVYGESVVEGFRENFLIVDHKLPVAHITCPAESTLFIPRRVVNDQGEVFYYMDIKGAAVGANTTYFDESAKPPKIIIDGRDIQGYSIIYGKGNAPNEWFRIGEQNPQPCSPEKGDCPSIGAEWEFNGQLATWNITNVQPSAYSLQLMVTDRYGNTSCHITQVNVDQNLSVLSADIDTPIFSPNGDGVRDAVSVEYQANEGLLLDIEIWNDTDRVRTVISGLEVEGISGAISWDGLDDTGLTVADGEYRILVTARSACGNQQQKDFPVTVDNTPPTAMINFPGTEEPLDIITEVTGTVTDTHLVGYTLRTRDESDGSLVLLRQQDLFVENGLLGVWNTFGLTGNWALVLSAEDLAGNTRTTIVPVSFGERAQLISSMKAEPRFFSPNGDEQFDTTMVTYELTDTVNTTLVVENLQNNPLAGESTPGALAGIYQFQWTGLDGDGHPLPDGSYRVKVTAESLSPPFVAQTEKITVIIDTTAPAIDIDTPSDASYHAGTVEVRGALRDPNLRAYQVTLIGGQEPYVFGTSIVNSDIVFSKSMDLPDGKYVVHVEARDAVENTSIKEVTFTVDTTRPRITLESPLEGEYFGGDRSEVAIRARIEETNLQAYRVQYGAGPDPAEWIELATGVALPPDTLLASWNVESDQALADGDYTLRVIAKDKAGGESEARVMVHVDNHVPELSLASPVEGGFVRESFAISGTVHDLFLKEYTLKLAGASCADAVSWSLLRTGSQPVRDGDIAALQTLPPDGVYCLRLAAEDFIGNTAAFQVNFTIDTTPPAPPLLSGHLEAGAGVALHWQGNTEPDLAGFNLYRNNVKISSVPITGTQLLDEDLEAGTYSYTVRAVDLAGWESADSNREAFTVDLTPPEAMIASPRDGFRVGNYIDIIGRAYSADDFKEYRLFSGFGENPGSWEMLRKSPVPVSYGTLVRWDAIALVDGLYTLRLEAEDLSGNVNIKTVAVTVDNTPPAAPVLLTATPDGSAVALAWQANPELDLAGYLVFRDGQLANASGPVTGDFTPYLIIGLDFADVEVPDGTHDYYLLAMDSAGNMSDQSNSLAVSLDTHAPHLTIVTPAPGLEFDKPIPVRAESEDTDIATVRFQYRASSGTVWTDFGGALTQRPYAVNLDPLVLGWENGVYRLRAVATDLGGLTDATPQEVEVQFKDVTPPAAPAGITVRVNGGFVTLTWQQNQEEDLAGYNVYLGESNARRNDVLLSEPSFLDPASTTIGLQPGNYVYRITAVDGSGNQSAGSAVMARVFMPQLKQQATPVHESDMLVDGTTVPEATVEIFRTLAPGSESLGNTGSDANGLFALPVTLEEGSNSLFAVATDGSGNISWPSVPIMVVYDPPPAAPTGLAAVVDHAEVALAWNANPEPDLAGYNIYRTTSTEWQQVNPTLVTTENYLDPGLPNGDYRYRVTAVDKTGGESGPSNEAPALIEQPLPAPPANLTAVSVSEGEAIDLCWEPSPDVVAGYLLFRGLVAGGPYFQANTSPIPESCYRDTGLRNGTKYFYVARSLDSVGNESVNSNEDSAIPQDGVVPDKPLLLLPTVSGRPYQSPSPQVDVTGYAEAGATVDLIHDQEWIDTVDAVSGTEHTVSFLTGYRTYETVVTPDGSSVYYLQTKNKFYPYEYYIYRQDLETGIETLIDQIPERSRSPVVSPDGTKIAYYYEDNAGVFKVGLYDIIAGTTAWLTTPSDVKEFDPAWSKDGTKVVFDSDRGNGFYDIWLHDLENGETTRVTEDFEGFYPEISYDGQTISFSSWDNANSDQNLYLVDVNGGPPVLLEADVDYSGYYPSVEWSPRTSQLAFTANRDGMYDIYVLDVDTGETRRLTETDAIETYLQWSPDGRQIAYYVEDGGKTEVRTVAVDGQGEDRLLHSFTGSVASDFAWLPAGIFYRAGTDLHRIIPPGTFVFNDVNLHPGANVFTARAQDAAGNGSEPADEIVVNMEAALMPDLEVLDQDIFILPEAPLAGEEATIGVTVRNASAVAAENVKAELYLWDARDNIRLIHAGTIPFLGPHGEAWLSVNWDSTGMSGLNTVYAVLDSDDEIAESREDNNVAIRDFHVSEEAGLGFETTLNGSEFRSDELVVVEVALHNSGPARDVRVQVAVEDENGGLVETLADQTRTLQYGAHETVELSWRAGSVLAGTYQVRTLLTDDAGGLIGEEVTPFTVLPDLDVAASLTTDRTEYGPGENVLINLVVTNQGANAVLPELKVRLNIGDATSVLHLEEQVLVNLQPEDSAAISTTWNTESTTPGIYRAVMEVFLGVERVAESASEFVIIPGMQISGTISVNPGMIFQDGAVQAGFTMSADGNVEAGAVPLKLLVLDTRDWAVVAAHEETVVVGTGQTVSGQHEFTALPWDIGVYQVLLQSLRSGAPENLAGDTFTVRDGVAPVVTVLAPAEGSVLSDAFDLVVTALDNAGSVGTAEYQVEGGAWQFLSLVNPATGRYAAPWTPVEADEGVHTLHFRATDLAGNTSAPVARAIVIQPRVEMTAALDKAACGMNEALTVNLALFNPAWRKQVRLVVGVETGNGVPVTQLAEEDLDLAANSQLNLNYTWNSGSVAAGEYRVRATLMKNGAVLADSAAPFVINQVPLLAGTLHFSADTVPAGEPLQAMWSVTNNGNFDFAGLIVEHVLADQASTPVRTWSETIALPRGQAATGSIPILTTDLALGSYQVSLKARYGYDTEDTPLAAAWFEVFDGSPPGVTIIAPAEGALVDGPIELAVSATDDGAGVANAEYRIDQGVWQSLALADPATSRYATLWSPEATEAGDRTIGFRAMDQAGNISEPVTVGVTVELCRPFAELTGSLQASPESLPAGRDLTLDYTLANPCAGPLEGLNIRVRLHDPATGTVVREASETVNIAAGGTAMGDFTFPSSGLAAGLYTATLAAWQADGGTRVLAETTFEIVVALEGEITPLDQVNLLVWLNQGQGDCQEEEPAEGHPGEVRAQGKERSLAHFGACGDQCADVEKIINILRRAAGSVTVVCRRADFEQELRNPIHTDILIIGDQHPLTDHHDDELREKVHSGTGLISFAWHVPGDGNGNADHKESFLGVTAKGVLPGSERTITLADSPVTAAGVLRIDDRLVRVEAAEDTEVVGRVTEICGDEDDRGHEASGRPRNCLYPVIVLHEYGLGRTVYAAFDPCEAFGGRNDELLADLLVKSVGFVHRPDQGVELVPNQLKSFALHVAGPGPDFELRVRATCPWEITLFDPAANDWVREYPWEVTLPVREGEPAILPYYILAPDLEGVFACEFNTGTVEDGRYTLLGNFIHELTLLKDRGHRLEEAATMISDLTVSRQERAKRDNALRYLRNIMERPVTVGEQSELNIHDLEKAIDSLLAIESTDIGPVRLRLDTLLRIEQGRWYFYE
ncbi:MAG: CARDB domain-containing protein [Desulfobulbaceae bacterium]